MEAVFFRVAVVSAAVSVILLPLLLISRWQKRYAPRTRRGVWLAAALVLLAAPLLPKEKAPVQIPAPERAVVMPRTQTQPQVHWEPSAGWSDYQGGTAAGAQAGTDAVLVEAPAPAAIPWTKLLSLLWLAGGAGILLQQGTVCLLVRRKLMRGAVPLAGHEALAWELCPRRSVRFFRSAGLDTPMTMGVLRPVVLLPEGEVSPAALRHELIHIRRGDVAWKGLLLLSCAVHWFNPLVWLMARRAGRDIEASCDAAVVDGAGAAERRAYGELLLETAAGRSCPFTTRFGGGKKLMKARLYDLFHPGKPSRVLVGCVLLACLLAGSMVACRTVAPDPEESASPSPAGQDEDAMESRMLAALEESITYENGQLSFTIPADYDGQDWNIHIACRVEYDDGMSTSLHYLDDVVWEAGKTYWVSDGSEWMDMTELTMDVTLGEESLSIDLLSYVTDRALYVNGTYGFALQLPGSWAGKYTAEEREDQPGAIEFCQRNSGNAGGWFFTLHIENARVFRSNYPGMSDRDIEQSWPVELHILGEGGENIFYIVFVSDVNYDLSSEEISAEYEAMSEDARNGLTAADFLYFGGAQADSPIEVVRARLEKERSYDYTQVLSIQELTVDVTQTKETAQRWTGSEIARTLDLPDEVFSDGRFVVVKACYYKEYDTTEESNISGDFDQFFYLVQNEDGQWKIMAMTPLKSGTGGYETFYGYVDQVDGSAVTFRRAGGESNLYYLPENWPYPVNRAWSRSIDLSRTGRENLGYPFARVTVKDAVVQMMEYIPQWGMEGWQLTFASGTAAEAQESWPEPFSVFLALPYGWSVGETEGEYPVNGAWQTQDIRDETGALVGAIGFNVCDIYPGKEDDPAALYDQVGLGDDTWFDVRENYLPLEGNGLTALADVWHIPGSNQVPWANWGILSRNPSRQVYVALELERESVPEDQARMIAGDLMIY